MKNKLIFAFSLILTACSSQTILKNNSHTITKASFYGNYTCGDYRTNEDTGTGIGVIYTIKLAKNQCVIDIEGYQIYRHILCDTQLTDDGRLELYQKDNHEKYVEMQKIGKNKFNATMHHYDKGKVYPLEKLP